MHAPTMNRVFLTVALLIGSNIFMTFAWYYHLKHKTWPLVTAILVSWGIAFFEYLLQVPANRIGHVSQGGAFTAPQLKVLQEAITLAVFTVFTFTVLKEKLRWTDGVAFGLIFLAVVISVLGRSGAQPLGAGPTPPVP